MRRPYRLLTRDPVSGAELVVTRLECPESGVVIEGEFGLGWVGRLTPDQLDFAGLLLRNRGNVQKAAAEMGVSYNTARTRLDEVVTALGGNPGEPEPAPRPAAPPTDRRAVLDRLERGELDFEAALRELRGNR